MKKTTNPRQAAFISLVETREGKYIENFFKEKESDRDLDQELSLDLSKHT